ncbi:MAG TPA: hypothetical protein VGF55_21950, partial [Gemmataceae bacterium]
RLALDTPDWILAAGDREATRVMDRARDRYARADAAIRAAADANPGLAGMGTTMTAARSVGAELVVAHVGHSRAYLVRGGELRQLTRDHTLAQELVDQGRETAEGARAHPFRRALTRVLGGTEEWAGADVTCADLCDGDQILLCTDGLTDAVDPAAVAAAVRTAPTAAAACDALIAAALAAGGLDNVTVALARYEIRPAP